jgi:putative copper resistance protein D
MNDFSVWLVVLVGIKLLLYLSISATLGGLFILSRQISAELSVFAHRYSVWACVVGLLAAISYFFVQVGQFAENGLLGLWDTTMLNVLWLSPVGDALILQLFAWLAIGLGLLRFRKIARWGFIMLIVLALCLTASLTLTGHTAEQAIITRLALFVHISVALWWMGALIPLWQSCHLVSTHRLQGLMQHFGKIATLLVPLLLLAGIAIAYQLTVSWDNLLTTPHGQLLLFKVFLVSLLLGLAARHKLSLAPNLSRTHGKQHLQQSIAIETLIGLSVLITSSILSTLIGPEKLV